MKNIIMQNIKTYEIPYDICWIYPLDLCNEEIFKTNLKNTEQLLKNFAQERDKKRVNENILKNLKFDIQKEIPLKLIKKSEEKIFQIKEKINENISPYYWRILEDFKGYFENIDQYIEVDFLLVLVKDDDRLW